MTNNVIIRKAKESDAKEIAKILNVQFKHGNYSKSFIQKYKNTEKKILKDMKECDYFVIERQSKILGVISLIVIRGTCKIDDLAVREGYQRKGLGSKLIHFAESYARKRKCHKIWCTSSKELKASGFYKKLDFRLEGVLRRHFDKQDFFYFSKQL
jgi:ribosomal protein S18 acetylase RimI-like enzyme